MLLYLLFVYRYDVCVYLNDILLIDKYIDLMYNYIR